MYGLNEVVLSIILVLVLLGGTRKTSSIIFDTSLSLTEIQGH